MSTDLRLVAAGAALLLASSVAFAATGVAGLPTLLAVTAGAGTGLAVVRTLAGGSTRRPARPGP